MQSSQMRWWQVAIVGLAAGTLAACGDSGEATGPTENRNDVALTASKPGELLAYVKDKLRARQAQRLFTPGLVLPAGGAPSLMVAATPAGDSVLRSGTTVQEAGVDEDDLIKSDGEFIYTLDTFSRTAAGQANTQLQAHRRLTDGRIEPTATLPLPQDPQASVVMHGMQFAEAARRVAVLSESVTFVPGPGPDPCAGDVACIAAPTLIGPPGITSSKVHVQLVQATASGGLTAGERISLSGRLVGTRLIGNALYVVSTYAPRLTPELLPADAASSEFEAALARLTTGELLPTLSINGASPQPLLADTDCYVQAANASLGVEVTTITVLNLGGATPAQRSRCIVGGVEALYMSTTSLVLATTRWGYPSEATALRYPPDIATDLHKFALDAAGPVYRASGSVIGHLGWDAQRKPYRMSEHNGDLRVLTFTGEFGWFVPVDAATLPPSPATLTVLRERAADQTLQVVSTLPNAQRPAPLGHAGEQVYAVRFLGERAYVVTFRQRDPLFVLDLSDPADPKAVGELAAPGYSDYLFPLADGLLFGVGRQASDTGLVGGVKVALFDVRDPAQPKELAVQTFGDRGSISALEFTSHGLNLLNVGSVSRIALPLFVSTFGAPAQQGLQRFEVDTAARTLKVKPLIQVPDTVVGYDLWGQRSLQIGAQVYYLSQGKLSGWDW